MAPSRMLCAGLLALAALVASTVRAGEAPAPASTDPVGEAIEKIKTSTDTTKIADLEDPRMYLVENRQQSLPKVLGLLDENDVQIHLNGAIILAKMAQAGDTSPTLIGGLQRCLTDSVSGVNYWGFAGLMSDNVPASAKRDALKQVINMDRPRPLRMAAIPTLMEKKPKAAIPIIIAHLQNILKDYKAQVQTKVSSEPPPVGIQAAPAPTAIRPGDRPYPMGRDLAAAERERLAAERERERLQAERDRLDDEMMRRQGMAMAPMAPAPGQPVARPQVFYRDDFSKMTPEQIQGIIPIVESLTAVKEVHLMGLTLEDLVRNSSPDEKLFGFAETVPWDLDQCVEKAVLWLQTHKADYEPAAPMPALKPAPTAATPVAPPAAPAAPAPSPAKSVR